MGSFKRLYDDAGARAVEDCLCLGLLLRGDSELVRISKSKCCVHALTLLRRRLQGLFGRSFQLEVRSEIGEGTTVTMRIHLRNRLGVGLESSGAITSDLRELASN